MSVSTGIRGCALLLFFFAAGCGEDGTGPEPVQSLAGAVVNGTETAARPEVVYLLYADASCTATLISPTYFLTAAHCINFEARRTGGTLYVTGVPKPYPTFTIDATYAFSGSTDNERYDIAVGRLTAAVPASLATPAVIADRDPTAGEQVTLIGYGCNIKNISGGVGSGVKRYRTFTWPPSDVSCEGDSGGPYFAGSLNGGGEIIATVSGSHTSQGELDVPAFPGNLKGRIEALKRSLDGGLEPGLNRAAGNLATTPASTPANCRDQCSRRADCRAFAWATNASCTMKSYAARAMPSTTTTSGLPLSQGVYDLPGADLAGSPFTGHTADSCEAKCAQTSNCNAYTFTSDNGNCWLKIVANAPTTTCPTCISGIRQSQEANVNRPGSDLPGMPIQVQFAVNCETKCAQRADCRAWSFNAGACRLKGFAAAPVVATNVRSGLRHGIEVNVDRPGSDISPPIDLPDPVPEDCQARCELNASCKAWTLVTKPSGIFGGTVNRCFLKSGVPGKATRYGVFSGRKGMYSF